MTQQNAIANNKPVAIIGYGTAGVNALIGLRNAGFEGEVNVFSNTGTLPYSPILTSYYAGGEKAYEECFPWSAEELDDLKPTVHLNCPVEGIDVDAHTIQTPEGTFEYSKCVIATGSRPMCYGFPQDCGYDPIVLRTMDDAERLKNVLENPKCERILISGELFFVASRILADYTQDVNLLGFPSHRQCVLDAPV